MPNCCPPVWLVHPKRCPYDSCYCSTMAPNTWSFASTSRVELDILRSFQPMQPYYDTGHFGTIPHRHLVESSPLPSLPLCWNCCVWPCECRCAPRGSTIVCRVSLLAPIHPVTIGNPCAQWCMAEHPVWLEHIALCEWPMSKCCDDVNDQCRWHRWKPTTQQADANYMQTKFRWLKSHSKLESVILEYSAHFDVVWHTTRFTEFIQTLLQYHRGWAAGLNVEREWKGVRSQFFHQALLQFAGLFRLLGGWVDLLRHQMQLLLEVQTHHLVLFASIAKAANHLAEDFSLVAYIFAVEDHLSEQNTQQYPLD